jgi:hypothetical protein
MRTLPQTWCQMWNDNPELAYKLSDGDFRMWSGRSANGDAVAGADGLAQFVARYQREKGVRFTPRLVVADEQEQRLAFSWDAAFPDGTVRGGIDVCTLRGGLITENWTLAGERGMNLPPEHDRADRAKPVSRHDIAALCQAWSPLWNGDHDLPAEIVSDDFRIWFGAQRSADDALAGPAALADYVRRHREGRAGLHFAKHRDPVIDITGQSAAFTWSATLPLADGGQRSIGGIDLFQITGGRFSRCWSVTGTRPFTL